MHEYKYTDKKNEALEVRHSVTSSTINPTWTGLGLNISLHNDKPVTNHSSHGTAPLQMHFILSWLLNGL